MYKSSPASRLLWPAGLLAALGRVERAGWLFPCEQGFCLVLQIVLMHHGSSCPCLHFSDSPIILDELLKKKKTQQKHEGKKKTLVVFLCVYVGRKGEEDEF